MEFFRSIHMDILDIYPVRKFFKGCIRPLIAILISFFFFMLSDAPDPIKLIQMIGNIITSGFPSIIGFVLTGYALIIGFRGAELIRKLSSFKPGGGEHSYFEIVNAIFAVVLCIIITDYILACITCYIIELKIQWPFTCWNSYGYNTVFFFIFLFFFYYSIFSLIDIVLNIFNIGKIANVLAVKEKTEVVENKPNIVIRIFRSIFSFYKLEE